MLPHGLSQSKLRPKSSIRTISPTPVGVSTNEVLDIIIPEIIEGMTSGFSYIDSTFLRSKLYLEVTKIVGDYPASSEVVDVKKHSSGAPCTHW